MYGIQNSSLKVSYDDGTTDRAIGARKTRKAPFSNQTMLPSIPTPSPRPGFKSPVLSLRWGTLGVAGQPRKNRAAPKEKVGG